MNALSLWFMMIVWCSLRVSVRPRIELCLLFNTKSTPILINVLPTFWASTTKKWSYTLLVTVQRSSYDESKRWHSPGHVTSLTPASMCMFTWAIIEQQDKTCGNRKHTVFTSNHLIRFIIFYAVLSTLKKFTNRKGFISKNNSLTVPWDVFFKVCLVDERGTHRVKGTC